MKLSGRFDTRRDAEMAVERLVQEHGVARDDVTIAASGEANSAGVARSGADAATRPAQPQRDDAALEGRLIVTVRVDDEDQARKVEAALAEFAATDAA